MQWQLVVCEDEEKRRELEKRIREYDEVMINVTYDYHQATGGISVYT